MKFTFRKNSQKEKKIPRPRESVYYWPIKHAFGLDFSDASIKAVEINQKGKKKFLQAHSLIDLPPNVIYRGEVKDPVALTKALQELLTKARPHPIATKYVVASFPEASVYLRPFEFPAALSKKQIIATVPFEAESELPIKINEMYTDIRFHRARDNGHHIVFTAAPRLMVDSYVKILSDVGLRPIAFELDSLALIRSLMDPSDDPIAILDIGAWSSTITIIEREMVHGYVSVGIGGSHITQVIAENLKISLEEAEKIKCEKGIFSPLGENRKILEVKLHLIIEEVAQAAKFHEQHTGRPVKRLVVSGGTALATDFIDYLHKNTGYEVIPGNPLANNSLSYSDKYSSSDKEDFAKQKEAFASTVGLAIRGTGANIVDSSLNLLPQQIKTKYEYWSRQLFFSLCSSFITLIVAVTLISTAYWLATIKQHRLLLDFEKNIFSVSFPAAEFEQYKKEIASTNQEIMLLKGFDDLRSSLVGTAENLTRDIPPGINVADLVITTPKKNGDPAIAQIKGSAATRSAILDFEKRLRSRPDIVDVDSPLTNLDRATNSPFSITLKLSIPHDEYATKP